jgi:hypothetical protein
MIAPAKAAEEFEGGVVERAESLLLDAGGDHAPHQLRGEISATGRANTDFQRRCGAWPDNESTCSTSAVTAPSSTNRQSMVKPPGFATDLRLQATTRCGVCEIAGRRRLAYHSAILIRNPPPVAGPARRRDPAQCRSMRLSASPRKFDGQIPEPGRCPAGGNRASPVALILAYAIGRPCRNTSLSCCHMMRRLMS